jgi:hypothetical protein
MKKIYRITSLIYCFFILIITAYGTPLEKVYPNSSSHAFEENKGQIAGDEAHHVLYVHKTVGMSMFLMPTGIAYQFQNYVKAQGGSKASNAFYTGLQLAAPSQSVETYRMDMELIGANPHAKVSAYGQSEDYANYHNAEEFKVYSYKRIIYENIYPNIDWVIYEHEKGIKYDFIVKPNGDPNLIQFKAKWVEESNIDESGNLIFKNRLGSVLEKNPVSFQQGETVATDFILKGDVVSFNIADYDRSKKLVIDPEIEWGTYYGGSGTDGLSSVTTDALGNVYACGITYGSNFLASGGFQNSNPALMGGIAAAYLVKFNSEGDRIWATYYSGGGFTGGISVAVDDQQNVYMTGFTYDLGLSFNGFQNSINGILDAYLVKFNPAGERLWATYFGGSEGEVSRTVAIDNQNNVYLTGRTFSSDFPVLNGYQETPGEEVELYGDAFLAKFNPLGDLIWSTYYGGAEGEFAFYVTCDDLDNVFITGKTNSDAGIFLDGHQSEYGGGQSDAFLAKYNAAGILQWSTYYGGAGEDIAYGCVTDDLGNAFITGETGSLTNISFNGFQDAPYASAFLAKFTAGGEREWGTYYGAGNGGPGSGANVGYACATDKENNVYMAGVTNSASSIASEGFQNSYGGGSSDAYIVKFTPSGDRLWGTYYGGSNNDLARGMHVDEASTVYLAGTTQSADGIFLNGFQSTQENETGFVTKIITCPNSQLLNLPEEVCAGSSLLLNPFPAGGSLQLLGVGEINQTTFTAPDVSETTSVTLQYTTLENGTCPSTVADFELMILPNVIASVSLTTSTEEICQNESVAILANIENAGSDPTIEWFLNGQLVLEGSSTFTSNTLADNDVIQAVVQNSNICSTPNQVLSDSIVFIVNPIPVVNVVFTNLDGGTLVSDFGFNSYQWFLDGQPITNATSSTLIPLVNGTYTVTVTNEFGCENSASTSLVTVSLTESVMEIVSIYPNPTDGRLTLNFGSQAPQSFTISNSRGETVYLNKQPMATELLDLRMLASGVYAITFYLNGRNWVEKLVVL